MLTAGAALEGCDVINVKEPVFVPQKVIMDGDWGGDELQLTSVLLAEKEKVKIIGATAVFGNSTVENCFENGRNILNFLKAANVKIFAGAASPSDAPKSAGDNAHGNDGIGGIKLPDSFAPIEKQNAVDFILQQLRENPANTITITCSGVLTNIAEAYRKEPETMRKVKQIVAMGGCTEDLPAADMPTRRGNITPNAEFNFFYGSQRCQNCSGKRASHHAFAD